MAIVTTERPLENGWLPDSPLDDTLLRQFMYSQAEVNELIARAAGGRADRTDDVFLADTGTPVPYLNQAILARPLSAGDDAALDVAERFFAGLDRPTTLLSIWPTPDLSDRGWQLVGHPAMVVRSPGPVDHEPPTDVELRAATTAEDLARAERIVIEGYPMDEARDLPPGRLFPQALVESGLTVRLGVLDGEPVAVGNVHVGNGVVNLCLGATLPAARRRGVWQALVWSRVAEDPTIPAVAYTSDFSRPGFLRMGFLPVTRFTLWFRPP
jgi:hypothetical protein